LFILVEIISNKSVRLQTIYKLHLDGNLLSRVKAILRLACSISQIGDGSMNISSEVLLASFSDEWVIRGILVVNVYQGLP